MLKKKHVHMFAVYISVFMYIAVVFVICMCFYSCTYQVSKTNSKNKKKNKLTANAPETIASWKISVQNRTKIWLCIYTLTNFSDGMHEAGGPAKVYW